MKKLYARWVPRLLTADQKRTRMKISEQCVERFNKNKTDFVRRFIKMDETWIHHYTPEFKQQSKQWTEAGCSAPKRQDRFHQQERSWHRYFGMLKAFFY
jgi:histone-lysine N-methyltransferase SETMAR